MDNNLGGGFNAQAHLFPFDIDNSQSNVIADANFLPYSACENKHGYLPLGLPGKAMRLGDLHLSAG